MYCAKEAFAESGYYATSISQVVQQAGIARGTFYQYFDNKLHIFQSILDSFLEDLQECIKPIVIGPGATPPLVQVQENLTRVLSLVLRERDLSRILLNHINTPDRVLEDRLSEFYRQLAEMIERSLKFGIAMKLVRPCNTRLTAYSIIGAVKEVALQLTSSKESQPPGIKEPPVEELVRELLEFGIGGILAGAKSHVPEVPYHAGGLASPPRPAVRQ